MNADLRNLKERQLAGLKAREFISEDCQRAITQLELDLGNDIEGKKAAEHLAALEAKAARLDQVEHELAAAHKRIEELEAGKAKKGH